MLAGDKLSKNNKKPKYIVMKFYKKEDFLKAKKPIQ